MREDEYFNRNSLQLVVLPADLNHSTCLLFGPCHGIFQPYRSLDPLDNLSHGSENNSRFHKMRSGTRIHPKSHIRVSARCPTKTLLNQLTDFGENLYEHPATRSHPNHVPSIFPTSGYVAAVEVMRQEQQYRNSLKGFEMLCDSRYSRNMQLSLR
jgi:hypothetical protein